MIFDVLTHIGLQNSIITLAIPYYSNPGLMAEAVESVLAQEDSRWRLLVVDDSPGQAGLAELPPELARKFEIDPRFRYIRNERNLGMAATWNRCIELAQTELVTLLHSDDRLLPHYCSKMLEAAARHPTASALFCGAQIIDGTGRPVFSFVDGFKRFLIPQATHGDLVLEGERGCERLVRGNFIMCPTLCYRKSRLGLRRFDSEWRQVLDWDFTVGVLQAGGTIVGLREKLYAYRRHSSNTTTALTASAHRFREEFAICQRWVGEFTRMGWQSVAHAAQKKSVLKAHVLFRVLEDLIFLRFANAAKKLRVFIEMGFEWKK